MTHVHFVVLVREPNRKTVFADGIANELNAALTAQRTRYGTIAEKNKPNNPRHH